jgi:DNA replication protein DnaC
VSVVDTALHDSLRTLKLSGMLHTLDARLAQAQAGELGHLDFLQVPCHDEITRRDTMSIQRGLRRAHFEQHTTLEEFDFHASPKLPAAQIRDLAALRWLQAGESVVLHGPVGVGKPTSHRPSATSPSAAAPTSASSKPAAPSPISPAVTPTGPGPAASLNSPDHHC